MRALLDTNVLYPTVMRDLLLGAASRGLFTPLWSPRILSEWKHVAGRRGPEDLLIAEAAIVAMTGNVPVDVGFPHQGRQLLLDLLLFLGDSFSLDTKVL